MIYNVKCPACGTPVNFPDDVNQVFCSACGNVIRSSGLATLVSNEIKKPEITKGDKVYAVFMWLLLIIPGAVYKSNISKAEAELKKIEQKIQHDASQVENYLEQRVVILKNLASLIQKEIDFEKDALRTLTNYNKGININLLNEASNNLNKAENEINSIVEKHPELLTNSGVERAMRDNDYLQREITAARECYNDSVNLWNATLFQDRAHRVAAAKNGYTTKIPFVTSREIREQARENFF